MIAPNTANLLIQLVPRRPRIANAAPADRKATVAAVRRAGVVTQRLMAQNTSTPSTTPDTLPRLKLMSDVAARLMATMPSSTKRAAFSGVRGNKSPPMRRWHSHTNGTTRTTRSRLGEGKSSAGASRTTIGSSAAATPAVSGGTAPDIGANVTTTSRSTGVAAERVSLVRWVRTHRPTSLLYTVTAPFDILPALERSC